MTEPVPDRPVRCGKCSSAVLILREVIRTYAEYQDGLSVNAAGQIVAQGEAIFAQGDPVPSLTRIECRNCGHDWHPRRYFAGTEGP